MNPPGHSRVRFGAFEVNLRTGEVRKQGHNLRLQDQPFQVLALLLEHPGELVTREELQQKLWPGDTFVDFDVGLNSAIKKLRDVLGDSAEHPRYVETLPRRGYRFIAQVESNGSSRPAAVATVAENLADEGTPGVPAAPQASEARRGPSRLWMGALALAALLAALNLGTWRPRFLERPAERGIQSLAVLPLENLTGDPGQEYFVDGMTDALITDLAQIRALRVISRTSAMRYKSARKPLSEIAAELNVDAVLEGSVVRSGSRVRINAQLVQARTDRHLWAQSYERDLGDIVTLQGDLARSDRKSVV